MSRVSPSIVISMAGTGQRFRAAGYENPKFALEGGGRTLLNWSLASLTGLFDLGYFIFAFCEADNRDGRVTDLISTECSSLGISEFKPIPLKERTRGQAETAYLALADESGDAPLFIWNIDTYVEPQALNGLGEGSQNAIYCFECAQDRPYSWVRRDEGGNALEVREKDKISNLASLGLYEFITIRQFRHAYLNTDVSQSPRCSNELYVAPMYNTLIREQAAVHAPVVDASAVHILGTPAEYEAWRTSCTSVTCADGVIDQ